MILERQANRGLLRPLLLPLVFGDVSRFEEVLDFEVGPHPLCKALRDPRVAGVVREGGRSDVETVDATHRVLLTGQRDARVDRHSSVRLDNLVCEP